MLPACLSPEQRQQEHSRGSVCHAMRHELCAVHVLVTCRAYARNNVAHPPRMIPQGLVSACFWVQHRHGSTVYAANQTTNPLHTKSRAASRGCTTAEYLPGCESNTRPSCLHASTPAQLTCKSCTSFCHAALGRGGCCSSLLKACSKALTALAGTAFATNAGSCRSLMHAVHKETVLDMTVWLSALHKQHQIQIVPQKVVFADSRSHCRQKSSRSNRCRHAQPAPQYPPLTASDM